MSENNMGHRRTWIKFFVVALPFVLNFLSLKNGHNWGDDFAQYILYAQNLMAGRYYAESIMVGLPIVYPPFYAIILIPFLYLFGMNFIILKALNIVFWAGVVWGAYEFFKLKAAGHAWRNAALISWSSYIFYYKQNVLSDIFFTGLVVLAVLSYEYFQKNSKERHFYFFLAISAVACLTRSAGFCLFMAAIIHLLLKEQKKEVVWTVLILLLIVLIQSIFLGTAGGYWHEIFADPWAACQQILHQSPLTWKALLWVFVPGQTVLSSVFNRSLTGFLDLAGFLLPLIMVLILIRKIVRKTISFTGVFFSVYILMAYVWAFFPEPAFALSRILLPVYIFAVFYLFYYLDIVSGKVLKARSLVTNVLFAVILIINCLNILMIYNFNDDVLFKTENRQLFAWVSSHIPKDELVMFSKPRALKLMTGNLATYAINGGGDERRVEQLGVRYIVLVTDRDLPSSDFKFIGASPDRFKLVWSNSIYSIFKVSDVGR